MRTGDQGVITSFSLLF